MITFTKGDEVIIECDDRVVEGVVILASLNGVSLMLEFEAILFGHVGRMPVLRVADDKYESLFGHPVAINRKGSGT